jgi:hypothetical protein
VALWLKASNCSLVRFSSSELRFLLGMFYRFHFLAEIFSGETPYGIISDARNLSSAPRRSLIRDRGLKMAKHKTFRWLPT